MAPPLPQGPGPGDPLLEACVESALAPYARLLPPDDLAAFRAMLVDFYTHNPSAARALDELRKAPVVGASGTVERPSESALSERAQKARAKRAPGGSR
jgi:hypothetical protein